MRTHKTIPVSRSGRPLGEHNPSAKLTDDEVEFIRTIYDDGFVGYRTIGKAFGVHWSHIRDIVQYRWRATTPDRYRKVSK